MPRSSPAGVAGWRRSPIRFDVRTAPDATKLRLLAAAEILLTERGVDGMSIRALAAAAGTSVSAVHYHFGSKFALVAALFEARLVPINRARLSGLEALVTSAAPASPTLEQVLDAFLRPSFEAWRAGEAIGRTATPHLLAQLHVDRFPGLEELKERLFQPVFGRYLEVVSEILPEQSASALRIGLTYVSGMLLHTVGGHIEVTGVTDEQGSHHDSDEALLRYLVDFSAAGLRGAGAVSRARLEELR